MGLNFPHSGHSGPIGPFLMANYNRSKTARKASLLRDTVTPLKGYTSSVIPQGPLCFTGDRPNK